MIQRIQSLLLLIAAGCFAAACFMPVGTITANETYYVITPWVFKENIPDGINLYPTYFIGMMQALLAILALVTIFLYKKRPLQSNLCLVSVLLNFILIGMMLWLYPDYLLPNVLQIASVQTNLSLCTLISVIPLACLYLSNKYIQRDEKKVRAADRLR
jgi:hypothetical protein